MQSDKLQGEIASLNGKVQDLMTENLTFQERLKVINFLILPRLQFILFFDFLNCHPLIPVIQRTSGIS